MHQEVQHWREFYQVFSQLSEGSVHQAWQYMQTNKNPAELIDFAKRLGRLDLGPEPRASPDMAGMDPRIRSVDMKALTESRIRVHAQPWTAVAGDGLVSDLISSFFIWDDAFFYPFIDREAFLEDMADGNPSTAQYCSPFLVNAICASRYFTSRRAQEASTVSGKDIGIQFLDEAKKFLDMELGRPSLPVAQGLALLFTLSAYRGTDRAGMMYRYTAYGMLRGLHLEKEFAHIPDEPQNLQRRQIISKAAWGFFCFESIVAYVYLETSLLPPPKISRCFISGTLHSPQSVLNVDFEGKLFTSESESPAFVPGILDSTCDLSLRLYDIMIDNMELSRGGDIKFELRQKRYMDLLSWRAQLPGHLRDEVNFTMQTCFLRSKPSFDPKEPASDVQCRVYLDELLISILRPLDAKVVFHGDVTVQDLLISFASTDVAVMERYVETFSLREYSCMTLCGLHNAVLTLVPHLADSRTHVAFSKAAFMIRAAARDFPMGRFILQGIKAMAGACNVAIPQAAIPHIDNSDRSPEQPKDVPVAFALPPVEAVRNLLRTDADSSKPLEMGRLISTWSTMSVGQTAAQEKRRRRT